MPHKHRRDKAQDATAFELPPTTVAKPLPVTKISNLTRDPITARKEAKSQKKNIKKNRADNDTLKAFARLMQLKANGRYPSGLDDGATTKRAKKRKRTAPDKVETDASVHSTSKRPITDAVPTIKPGEKLSEFSARVNAALPISGLIGKKAGGKDPAGVKTRQTKLEKRMQRMQGEWREVDKKKREERETLDEERETADLEHGVLPANLRQTSKRKKGKPRTGGADSDDGDIWGAIAAARNEAPRRLHDVVQAPPQLTKVPRQRFRVREGAMVNVADVPKTAGSLRKREELEGARMTVVEQYRELMERKRERK
ncbi:MAG: hypothetical protein M1817_003546 [Caeruleum heppii]|nr:MAG: hypothetical protein M1817_003546 [Caeruleum heppii]